MTWPRGVACACVRASGLALRCALCGSYLIERVFLETSLPAGAKAHLFCDRLTRRLSAALPRSCYARLAAHNGATHASRAPQRRCAGPRARQCGSRCHGVPNYGGAAYSLRGARLPGGTISSGGVTFLSCLRLAGLGGDERGVLLGQRNHLGGVSEGQGAVESIGEDRRECRGQQIDIDLQVSR